MIARRHGQRSGVADDLGDKPNIEGEEQLGES